MRNKLFGLDRSTILHLRFPFSFFLMPVFLFALSQAGNINWAETIIAFIILHILIFPSSNGYNSYQDRDESSIGGLRRPPPVTKQLYKTTLIFDVLAVLLGLFVSPLFSLLVLTFILVSRAYSYRAIRLKRNAIIGFITVFLFQGAFVYYMSMVAITGMESFNAISNDVLICMGISSLFIGSLYPLTQIYQHQADKNDGVISMSYKLGYRGTFVFAAILFSVATSLMYYHFYKLQQIQYLNLFLLIMLPVVIRLSVWFFKVIKNTDHANFDNTMSMNLVTSVCMNLYFLFLIINRYGNWY